VTRSLSNHGRTVRIPVYVTDNVARYKKTVEDLYIRTGKSPDPEDVAKEMGIKIAEAKRLREFVSDISPLDKMETTDDANGRGIPEGSEPSRTDKAIAQLELDQQMEELLGQLTPREANILRYRYGLMDGKAHTLEETGREFSLTRERIRQIEKDAMKRLRSFVTEHIEDYKP
jgi:RNA polymerase primary sigma factor